MRAQRIRVESFDASVRGFALSLSARLERLLAPTLTNSRDVYEETLAGCLRQSSEWLDVGCGHHILPAARAEREKRLVARCRAVIGLDVDLASLKRHQTISRRVVGQMASLPFADERFDLVTANMVVEHVDHPTKRFQEIARVLRPGGMFLFQTPNAWCHHTMAARMLPGGVRRALVWLLDGRREGEVFPTYYRVNTARHVARAAAEAGLHVQCIRREASTPVFRVIPPLALLELVWIRLTLTKTLEAFRTNLIAVLRKEAQLR